MASFLQSFQETKQHYWEIGSSLGSALSGNPSSLDDRNTAFWNRIEYGRQFQEITNFSIPVEQYGEAYDTLWMKSSNGAYCLVRTKAPYRNGGEIKTIPAYVLLFSSDPPLLGRLFLKPNARAGLTDDLISNNVSVVSARYEKDIIPSGAEDIKKGPLNFSWARDAASIHRNNYQQMMKEHGILTKDGERIWRSGSSIFWASPNEEEGGFDLYYYCNPRYGREGMFLTEATLSNNFVRRFMSRFSLKVNEAPIEKEGLDRFIREKFPQLIRAQLHGQEPYYLSMPDGFWNRLKRKTKTGTLRSLQRVSNFARNLNWKMVIRSSALTGVLTAGLYMMGQGLWIMGLVASTPAAAMKGNVLFRAISSSIRRMSMYFTKDEDFKQQGVNAEIGRYFCDETKVDFANEVKNFPLKIAYLKSMQPVPLEKVSATFKEVVPYNDSHEREWAKSVILDTMGCQPGTIFTEMEDHGYSFLVAQQPNGLDVDYHPERGFAYACRRHDPEEGFALERPIQHIFDTLDPKTPYYAVKHMGKGMILDRAFGNQDDFPTALFEAPMACVPETFEYRDIQPRLFPLLSEEGRRSIQEKQLPILKEIFDVERAFQERPDIVSEMRQHFTTQERGIITYMDVPNHVKDITRRHHFLCHSV